MTTAAGAGHEFSAIDNETFKGLVTNMTRSGIVVVVASLILVAYNAVAHFDVSLGGTPSPAIYYVDLTLWILISLAGGIVGVLLVRATAAFKALIHTEGNDIAHLMTGMAGLRDILGLIFWAAVAGAVLLATSFVLLLVYS